MTSNQPDNRSRIDSARSEGKSSNSGLFVMLGILGLVLVAGIAAVLISGGGGDDDPGDVATTAEDESSAATESVENAAIEVAGTALVGLAREGADPAVGELAPSLTGTAVDGSPLIIENDGRPKLVAFVAHWCPHCQREVPSVAKWLADRGPIEGVDLYAVSTAVDSTRDNYPPSAWLADEGWTIPTMADSASSDAANAFGLTGFPYWVAIDGDGTVLTRLSGEQPTSVLDALVTELTS